MGTIARLLLIAAACCIAPASRADTQDIDTFAMDRAVKAGALVWDAREEKEYAAGHIPGAVNIGYVGEVFRDANREDPPSAAAASRIFGGAGMDILRRDVVVYTRKGDPFAYYGARMVEY